MEQSENLHQKFLNWLESSDIEFYNRYNKYYQDTGETITLLTDDLTFEESVILRHKFNLYQIWEGFLTK